VLVDEPVHLALRDSLDVVAAELFAARGTLEQPLAGWLRRLTLRLGVCFAAREVGADALSTAEPPRAETTLPHVAM
jgi:hypothetical protein